MRDIHSTRIIKIAGLLIIKENKLLLAYSNNKKAWYLLGGKIETGESPQQSLQRERWEELTLKIKVKSLKYYCHITAPAYGEDANVRIEQDCFLYELHENIIPNNEIGAVSFFDSYSYEQEPAQVIGVFEVFKRLKADGLII